MKRQRARRPRGVAPAATLDSLEDATAQKPASRRGLFAAFTAVLLVATFAAYWPSLSAGFIWDDDDYVTNNVAIRSSSGLVSIWTKPGTTVQYYPMVFTTFWLEYRMWNLNPAGYHATNILLHALCALLFSLVLRQLGVPGAVLSAFAFALHPVCVESVAWVTERKNVLSTVFYLSSALVFLKTYDLEDVFREAVSIPLLLCHRNFSLHVLRIRVEETRRPEEKRRWRSKGWTVEERRLLEVVDQRLFQDPSDWRDLLPEGLESFTTIDLASSMGIGRDLAQKAAYCLREAGVIEQAGKRGRSLLYRLASTP
ncbi:MAG: hypothetical protein IT186_24305 [Acidobacteria bacterium]|nr:hypothetical protein [Acidobacteriota bacterium]